MTNDSPTAVDNEASAPQTTSPPMTPKRLNAAIGYFASVVVACAVIMWSVFNTWLNVLAYRANESEDQAWGITAIMVIATCVIPLGLGLLVLFKSLSKNQKR